jgi:hypothetical protein
MSKRRPTPRSGPYEIAHALVLSTGHITRKDSDLLDRDTAPVIAFQKAAGQGPTGKGTAHYDAFGYWVHVPDAQSDADFARSMTAIQQAGYSPALVELLQLARRLGCQWLMLDRDGELRSDLPRFDW